MVIGVIVGAHGVRGDVRVSSESDVAGRLTKLKSITLALPNGETSEHAVTGSRPHSGKAVELMSLSGCQNREEAQALTGSLLVVREEDSPPLPGGEYYEWQLIGLQVYTTDGRDLGKLVEVLRTGANDVYVTDEALVPAISEVIREIDLDGGKMVIEPIPGLLE